MYMHRLKEKFKINNQWFKRNDTNEIKQKQRNKDQEEAIPLKGIKEDGNRRKQKTKIKLLKKSQNLTAYEPDTVKQIYIYNL